jgi:hypothetical protein
MVTRAKAQTDLFCYWCTRYAFDGSQAVVWCAAAESWTHDLCHFTSKCDGKGSKEDCYQQPILPAADPVST